MSNNIQRVLTAGAAGLVFGAGLIVAGMVNPNKVLSFLDIAGRWDPSLAFVIVGAIAVGAVAFAIAKRRERSLIDEPMQLPATRTIDRRLVVGSLLFGVGWGIAGFCPGPAIVALGTSVGAASGKAFIFVGAMLAGMFLFEMLERRSR